MGPVRILAWTMLAAALASPACARRDAPYRFRAPLVSAVRAEHLPATGASSAVRRTAPPPADPARAWLTPPPHAHGTRAAAEDAGSAGSHRPAAVVSKPAAASAASPTETLRALVGSSTRGAGSAAFALATLAELGAHIDARVRQASSGAHVLNMARERDAVLAEDPPLTGDLVVLSGKRNDRDEELLVGIVVMPADDASSAVELVYAEDGAVRHGVVTQQACRERQERAPATARCLSRDRVRAYLALERLAP
jgi:hypothetical protein